MRNKSWDRFHTKANGKELSGIIFFPENPETRALNLQSFFLEIRENGIGFRPEFRILSWIKKAVTNLRIQSNPLEISKVSLNGMEISRKEISKFLGVLGAKLDNVQDISIPQTTTVNQNMIFHPPLDIFGNVISV